MRLATSYPGPTGSLLRTCESRSSAHLEPIFAEEFGWVLGANGSVSACEGFRRAKLVAAPADAVGILGMERDLRHSRFLDLARG